MKACKDCKHSHHNGHFCHHPKLSGEKFNAAEGEWRKVAFNTRVTRKPGRECGLEANLFEEKPNMFYHIKRYFQ